MNTDPWLSDARRQAQLRRAWCLRDRGGLQPRASAVAPQVAVWVAFIAACSWCLVKALT